MQIAAMRYVELTYKMTDENLSAGIALLVKLMITLALPVRGTHIASFLRTKRLPACRVRGPIQSSA
jgi:hypothetical protein